MAKRIYVGNLSYRTTTDQLRDLFSQAGEVQDVFLPSDRETGRMRGFGFVEFADDAATQEAIRMFDGYTLDDRQLRVNEAQEKPQGGGGGGGDRRGGDRRGGGGGRGGYGRY